MSIHIGKHKVFYVPRWHFDSYNIGTKKVLRIGPFRIFVGG